MGEGPSNGRHVIATWAGFTALFSNLAAIGVIDLFSKPDETSVALSALITSGIVAASVYSKQRWDDAKAARAAREKATRRIRRDHGRERGEA